MKQRFRNMLDAMIQEIGATRISGYEEVDENRFELDTYMTKELNQRTLLKFMPTANMEKLRVEMVHIWGHLDFDVDLEEGINQMLSLLVQNTGSFRGTSAFIGVTPVEDNFFVTMNGYHHFLMKWSDEDIGKALAFAFFDLMLGFTSLDQSLTILKPFAPN